MPWPIFTACACAFLAGAHLMAMGVYAEDWPGHLFLGLVYVAGVLLILGGLWKQLKD